MNFTCHITLLGPSERILINFTALFLVNFQGTYLVSSWQQRVLNPYLQHLKRYLTFTLLIKIREWPIEKSVSSMLFSCRDKICIWCYFSTLGQKRMDSTGHMLPDKLMFYGNTRDAIKKQARKAKNFLIQMTTLPNLMCLSFMVTSPRRKRQHSWSISQIAMGKRWTSK